MQQAMDRSAQDARTDQLTGLPNRRGVLEELDRRLAGDVAFIFALADLNGFKQYNDTFGHPAGDELLRRLGERLATSWAGLGYAARLGGDEFCVIGRGAHRTGCRPCCARRSARPLTASASAPSRGWRTCPPRPVTPAPC
jgi:diguanylate cyclase (GGDEF)-like protein